MTGGSVNLYPIIEIMTILLLDKKNIKRRGMKGNKAQEGRWDSRVKQVKRDRISKVRVWHIL